MLLSRTVLAELYQETLVTEDEVESIKVEGDSQFTSVPDRVVVVQLIKSPDVVKKTAEVLDKYGHNEEAKLLKGW